VQWENALVSAIPNESSMVTDRPSSRLPAAPSGAVRGFHARILATNEGLRAMVAQMRASAGAAEPSTTRPARRGAKREDV
jgi:hypothetical protein